LGGVLGFRPMLPRLPPRPLIEIPFLLVRC
jgi:hypothetical protein